MIYFKYVNARPVLEFNTFIKEIKSEYESDIGPVLILYMRN